jgi:hypothetical protein
LGAAKIKFTWNLVRAEGLIHTSPGQRSG